jgi:hypothetical protein
MVDLNELEQVFTILNTFGTIILIILFWKTINYLQEQSKNARIQTNYRFRPWIGPTNSIKPMSIVDNRHQFVIELKNYGEIPASNVIAMYKMNTEIMSRELANNSESLDKFNLGPLLPNMEKRYWFFIESDLIEKAKNGSNNIFILLYFVYEHLGGKSCYGMISQYEPKTNSFVHKDMWVDT